MKMLHLKMIIPKHGLYDFEPVFFELFIPILQVVIISLSIYFGLHFFIGFIVIGVSLILTNYLLSDRYGNWIYKLWCWKWYLLQWLFYCNQKRKSNRYKDCWNSTDMNQLLYTVLHLELSRNRWERLGVKKIDWKMGIS